MLTTPEQPAFCAQCGTQLRRGKPSGARCDVCERAEPVRLVVPDGYYDTEQMCRILGSHDFGALFRRLRTDHGLSQQDLATLTGLSQRYISDLENGRRQMQYIKTVAPVSTRLGIPGTRLGFRGRATVRRTVSGWKDDAMFRRDFVGTAAGLTLGMAAGLDIDRLLALLPPAEPSDARRIRRIGVADVEVIEQITAEFSRQDFAHGSGLIQAAVIEQLRTTLPLLTDTELAPGLRPRLMLATADLAMMAGYSSFDCADHAAARRLWLVGLSIARHAEHPLGSDLTVFLLDDMALQAVHLDRPDEALGLVRIGETASIGRHPVSASTTVHLKWIQALAHAAQGDAAACQRALGQAEEHFTRIDPAATPWGWFLNEVHFASVQGDAHYALALGDADARAAGRAVTFLSRAVDHLGPGYARSRALRLPGLAGAHALSGDIDTAVTLGHEAIDAVTAMSSARAVNKLRTLHTVLEPMQGSSGVAELRERLVAVTT